MRRALILALTCTLAACTLTSPKPDAVTGLGDGGITATDLAAPRSGTTAASEAQAATPATPHPTARPTASGAVAVPALSALVVTSRGEASAAPGAQVATPDTPHPKPRPSATGAAQAEPAPAATPEAPPPKPKSTLEIQCVAAGGVWGQAGTSGAFICQKKTRDGGKICRSKGDCQGVCLAASRTCAPVTPLLGCNDVLDEQGRRFTLCLN